MLLSKLITLFHTEKEERHSQDFQSREQSLTCFLSADCELFAGKATANLIVGVHADAINTGWVQLYNVGLVVGGRDVPGCVHVIPGVCQMWRDV